MNAELSKLLQLFADGGAEGGAAAGTGQQGTVEQTADDGQMEYADRLRALGVPEDKIRGKRAKGEARTKAAGQAATEQAGPGQDAAAAQTNGAQEENQAEQAEPGRNGAQPSGKPSFDELMQDPEYNQQMQQVVRKRLKNSQAAQQDLDKLAPALELLAGQYGLDVHAQGFDLQQLADAVTSDAKFYEEKAAQLGTTVETAMRVDRMEREAAERKRQDERNLEQQRMQRHYMSLQQQAQQMRELFPGFDLQQELRNPVFARMTAPDINLPVRDAYYAVHREQLQAASMQVAAQKTAQKLSNAIASGQARPAENGTTQQPASTSTLDYRNMTRQQRDALKQQIRRAAARGEKVYPGR